jgi:hypothetical protein
MAVSQIVPYLDARYIMCVYPFAVLICISGVYYAFSNLAKRYTAISSHAPVYCTIALGILLLLLNNAFYKTSNYLYIGGQETIEIPEHTVCVYVMADRSYNVSAKETTALAKCDKVAVSYLSSLEVLRGTYQYQEGETVLVFVHDGLDVESTLDNVKNVLDIANLKEYNRIVNRDNSIVYFAE